MAQNRGGLSSVDEIEEEEVVEEQPAKEPGLGVMVGSGKSAMLASPSTLEAMAELYNQRMEKQGSFMEALKDAAAWTGGGIQGPTETLKMRDEQRSRQAAELFSMQNQIAQHRQAMKMADAFLGTTQPTAAAQGETATDQVAPSAGGRAGGLIDMVKDPNLRRQIGAQYLSDPKAAMTQLNKYLMETGQTGELWKRITALGDSVGKPGGLSPEVFNQIKAGMLIGGDLLKQDTQLLTDPKTGLIGDFKVPLYKTAPVSPGTPAAAAIRNPAPPAMAAPGQAAPGQAAPGQAAPGQAARPPMAAPGQAAPGQAAPGQAAPGQAARPPVAEPTTVAPPEKAPPASSYATRAGLMPGSVQDAQLRQKAAEAGIAGLEEEEKGGGKEAAMGKAALQAAGESAGVRDAALINIENLVTKFKNSVGPLAKPGMLPAILTVVQEGVSAGNFGQVGMPGIERAVRQLGGGQAEIDAAQELGREFATIQLNNSRSFLKGQGAVSDAERRLIAMMSGTTGDSPGAIKRFVQWQRKLASYDEAIWNDYIKWRKVNKAAKFEDFTLSDTYQNRRKAYTQELVKLAKSPLPVESEKPSGAKKSLDSHPGRALLDKYPKR